MFSKTHLVWFCLAGAAWLGCSDETSSGTGGQSAGGQSAGGASTGGAGTGGQSVGGAGTGGAGGASVGGAGTGGQGGAGLDPTPCVTACEGQQPCEAVDPVDCAAVCDMTVQAVTALGCEAEYAAAYDCVNALTDLCTAPNDCFNELIALDQCINP